MTIHKDFSDAFGERARTDKVSHHGYQRFYPFFLNKLREIPARMIEIGVDKLESVEFWCRYFPDVSYYGVDLHDISYAGTYSDRVTILKGDQSDPNFLKGLSENLGEKVDFIIDDGSHVPEHQILTFDALFNSALKDGGIYIIEDIETSYWKRGEIYGYSCSYGVGHPRSVVEIFKGLVNTVNKEFCLGELFAPHEPISHDVINNIEMISFAQNAIIIVKKDRSRFSEFYDRPYRMAGNA